MDDEDEDENVNLEQELQPISRKAKRILRRKVVSEVLEQGVMVAGQ